MAILPLFFRNFGSPCSAQPLKGSFHPRIVGVVFLEATGDESPSKCWIYFHFLHFKFVICTCFWLYNDSPKGRNVVPKSGIYSIIIDKVPTTIDDGFVFVDFNPLHMM